MAAWLVVGLGLLALFPLHLFPAFMAGLLVYELIILASPLLRITRIVGQRARLVVAGLLSACIVGGLGLAVGKTVESVRNGDASLTALLQKMAEVLDGLRATLPAGLTQYLPENAQEISQYAAASLRSHAEAIQGAGAGAGLLLAHVLIGMVLGAVVALGSQAPDHEPRPLALALGERVRRLGEAFRAVVFAQVRISALNTTFTLLYLAAFLPAMGVQLPLVKTMVAITFLAGLLPVVGNLISNGVILVVSLSYPFPTPLWSLAFLLCIHKLEYFLNARIVGGRIHSRTWELLLAMLVMEAAFGLSGLVAAPIYYAYAKKELGDRGLV